MLDKYEIYKVITLPATALFGVHHFLCHLAKGLESFFF